MVVRCEHDLRTAAESRATETFGDQRVDHFVRLAPWGDKVSVY